MENKKTKRSPTTVIEQDKSPELEISYIKYPGKDIIPFYDERRKRRVVYYPKKAEKLMEESNNRTYTHIHTHPSRPKYHLSALPSPNDLYNFLSDNQEKAMIIAQRNEESGKVEGYFFLRKTKKTKPSDIKQKKGFWHHFTEIEPISYFTKRAIREIGAAFGFGNKAFVAKRSYANITNRYESMTSTQDILREIEHICQENNLNYRFVPTKTHELDMDKLRFIKKSKLEKKLTNVVAIILLSFIFSITFLSSNLTGFAIANLTQKTSNTIGIVLFIIGLIGIFYHFRRN